MKKVISMTVAAMMLTISAHAATTYDVNNESVTADDMSTYKTVLISKGEAVPTTSDEIVYVNQADANSTFTAGTEFLLKKNVADGLYTVRFGGDSTASSTFYVGVANDTTANIAMEAVGAIEKVEGGFGIGYKITTEGSYKNLLIEKTDGTVIGCELKTTISTDGAVEYGVQINADTEAALSDIAKVYLSTRTVEFEEVQQ